MKSVTMKFIALLLLFVPFFQGWTQVDNDETLMTIAGKKITVGEFMNIYQKNNVKGEAIDKKSLEEYLDLFINFKLKVKEAEELGLDTLSSFRKELSGYREQLAKPYLTDEATIDMLVKEAYDRSQTDIRASHIFFRVKPDATPDDTLVAFNRANEARKRLMNGESFEQLTVEVSDDPSAKDKEATAQHPYMKGNRGDLGYFTVFDMIYPFESAAYNTPVGNVSPVIRTDYGYHLILVREKRPALYDFTVAHLYLMIPRGSNHDDSLKIQKRIDSLYTRLLNGEKFEDLVKQYSDDKGSVAKGGVLPKRGVNRLVPEFIEPIYALKNPGDITKPILTSYGWHILKLVERKNPLTFEEEKATLKLKVTKDGRSNLSRIVVLDKIKKEYGFQDYPGALKEMIPMVTDSIFAGKWNATEAKNMTGILFRIGNLNVRQNEFADYLASKQRKREKENITVFVQKMYKDFTDETLLKWENSHLEQKYPEFKALMQEYRDGILLFDLTDQKVWSKAVKDTTGLKEYYQKNKQAYMWDTRLDASIYNITDQAAIQRVKNFIVSGLNNTDILKEINNDTTHVLYIESAKFSKKENPIIDSIPWKPGFSSDIKTDSSTIFVYVKGTVKPEPKAMNEARGLITADYQNYLEKEWIKALRAKYPVVVKREVLARIK